MMICEFKAEKMNFENGNLVFVFLECLPLTKKMRTFLENVDENNVVRLEKAVYVDGICVYSFFSNLKEVSEKYFESK